MATPKPSDQTSKWDFRTFVIALRKKENAAPASLATEELALLEILELGSPKELAEERKYLVSYFKKCFVRDHLSKALSDQVGRLASTRNERPTKAQIKAAATAGWFEWSPEEREAAESAVVRHRGNTAETSRSTPAAGE